MRQGFKRLFASGILFLGLVAVCQAQLVEVSPGTLSQHHRSLEGPLGCLKCHESGGAPMPDQCLSCHPEISWLKANSRGFHGQQETDDCAACHAEHGGSNRSLTHFPDGGAENFNHRRAGWPLADKHAALQCQQCHQEKFQVSEAVRLSPRKERAGTFIGLEPVCSTCHEDVHRGGLGENCLDCHSPAGWRQAPENFDHSRTGYVLTGSHMRVACQKCHPESSPAPRDGSQGGARLVLERPHERCSDCHRDPHQGRAGATCSRCHVTDSFFRTAQVTFDHDRTTFPLVGKHLDLRCEKCHEKGPAGAVLAADLKMAARAGCGGCHFDAHGGQLTNLPDRGECASCHTAAAWKPVTFSVEAHAAVGYPLQGRHALVECQYCHGPDRKGPPLAMSVQQLGKSGFAFDLQKPSCWGCHLDPHGGVFSPGGKREKEGSCLACHDLDGFRPSTVDPETHEEFGFPITGAHRTTRCDRCHSEIQPDPEDPTAALSRKLGESSLLFVTDGRCVSCHESKSPHGDQFVQRPDGGACGSCHGDEKFKPADRFDHEQGTLFPLLGSHQNVECGECHNPKKKRKKRSSQIVIYKGTPIGCRECHRKGVPARPIS